MKHSYYSTTLAVLALVFAWAIATFAQVPDRRMPTPMIQEGVIHHQRFPDEGYVQQNSGGPGNISSLTIPPILDKTFGSNGTVTSAIAGGGASNDEAISVAIQSDGKIVAAGYSADVLRHYAFALSRYNPDGTLDNTFGTNGTVRNTINGGNGTSDAASSVAIQSDGKVVAVGSSSDASGHYAFALSRYNPDGTPDSTFGTNGTVRNAISGGNGTGDGAKSVTIRPDGKILAAGYSSDASGHYAFALARYNQDGTLDNTFGTNGTLKNAINGGNGSSDVAWSVAIQPDGKIIVAGVSKDASGHYAFALARYNGNGTLDNTFGTGGTVRNTVSGGNGSYDYAESVTLQSDGKIVAAGDSKDASGHYAFALARYNTDGTLDNTFGTGGTIRSAISGGSSLDWAASVALQSDGKIVAAGGTENADENDSLAMARFNTDGTLDNTFGTNGTIKTAYNGGNGTGDLANSVVIQSDGKIVVAGDSWNASGGTFALARFNSNGTFDNAFGTGGSVRNAINGGSGSLDWAQSVAIQPDGRIVAAGYSEKSNLYSFALARYNSDGTLDNTFGTKGTVRNSISGGNGFWDKAYSVAIQTDGKIVAAGTSTDHSIHYAFAMARYNSDGTLDNTFGTNGTVRTTISGGDSSDDEAYSVAIQADGKIVAAGDSHGGSVVRSFALARYNTDGTLDNTFGTNGTVRNAISGCNVNYGYSVVIQADGKIVVGGYSAGPSFGDLFALVRYNSDGTLDNTFGTNGTVTNAISGGRGYDKAYSVAIQPDGKIVAGGMSSDVSWNSSFALARYNLDGSLDNTFGTTGSIRSAISGGNGSDDEAYSVAMQSYGKIVAAGRSKDASGNYSFAMARYNSDGTPDNTFSTNGSVRHAIYGSTGSDDEACSAAIQPDGKTVAAGFSHGGSGNSFALARYLVYPYSAPALVSPNNNTTNQPTLLTLNVNSVAGVSGYHWQVSANSSFSTTTVNDSTTGAVDTAHVVTLTAGMKYYWRVQAFGDGASAFSAVDSFTTMAVPSAPTLASPGHNALNQPPTITLKINPAPGASGYHWQVSVNSVFSSAVVNDSTTGTGDTAHVATLTPSTEYFWRVQAYNLGGAGAYSNPDSFTVMSAPAVPVLAFPAPNDAFLRVDTLILRWHPVPLVTGYICQISQSQSFTSLVVIRDSTADTTFVVTSLKNQQKYYWRVSAYNTVGAGAFSVVDSFTTIVAVPMTPVAVTPVGTTGEPRRTTFKWNCCTNATWYHLQVATDNSLDSVGGFVKAIVVLDTTLADTAKKLSLPLSAKTKYYWHVCAWDTAGASAYSSVAEFTTGKGVDAINEPGGIPKEYSLSQNYPNPFNPTTTIRFDLKEASDVTLEIYNVLGQRAEYWNYGMMESGRYEKVVDMSRYASGVYFYRIVARGVNGDSFVSTKKLVLEK